MFPCFWWNYFASVVATILDSEKPILRGEGGPLRGGGGGEDLALIPHQEETTATINTWYWRPRLSLAYKSV